MLFQLYATVPKPEIWMRTDQPVHLLLQGTIHMADGDCAGVLVGKSNRHGQANQNSISPFFVLLSNQNHLSWMSQASVQTS